MHQIRQVLVRMRMGESNRAIAKAGLMGRNKVAELRKLALHRENRDTHTPRKHSPQGRRLGVIDPHHLYTIQ